MLTTPRTDVMNSVIKYLNPKPNALSPTDAKVSNTLLLQDIVYKSGPGINTYGMPKGLALKMNKDEEVLLSIAHTLAPATPSNFSHPLYIYSLTLARSLFFHSHPPPIHIRDKTQYQAARIPCSEMCLYTREVYFYSSGIQREVDVLSPEVYGVWTDGTANDEFNCIMLEDMTVNWKGFSGYVRICMPYQQEVGLDLIGIPCYSESRG